MTRLRSSFVCGAALVGFVLLSVPVARAQAPTPAPQGATLGCPEIARVVETAVRNDARLRDWPDLARYRDANAKAGRPAPGDLRVVYMGDSITDSWQQPRFAAGFDNRVKIDRGISGQTTPQMLIRLRPDVIALAPKVVVILAGTNDISANTGPATDEEIEGNLASMMELAAANGIKVVLSSILPTGDSHVAADAIPQTTRRPLARIKTVNTWARKYAAEHGHVYLDYFAAMVDDRGLLRADLSDDDLHPNAKGYAIMAPLAEAAIAQALGRH